MKFRGVYPPSQFTEHMTSRDARQFNNAFSATNKHSLSCQQDRQWVEDVFIVFAMATGATECVCIQAFKTGKMERIYTHLSRWVSTLKDAEHEALADTKAYRIGSGMKEPALKAIQAEWSRALGVRHPSEALKPINVMSHAVA